MQRLLSLLKEQQHMLLLAESCTGGLLAKCVSDVPGASEVFLGGVVAYSVQLKEALLSVPARLLDQYGPVSAEVCLAMAHGMKTWHPQAFIIATTGYASPHPSNRKKVGTVYLCIAQAQFSILAHAQLSGDRQHIRNAMVSAAEQLSIQHLQKQPLAFPPFDIQAYGA